MNTKIITPTIKATPDKLLKQIIHPTIVKSVPAATTIKSLIRYIPKMSLPPLKLDGAIYLRSSI